MNAAGNIDLNGVAITLNGGVTTSAGGSVTITNSGQLTIASAADMSLAGLFLQDGAGSVSTGGDIVTTGDTIDFSADITLTESVLLDTGAGANISFSNAATIDDGAGGPWNLTLDAPGAVISFGAASGAANGRIGGAAGANRIGALSITDAATVTFNGEVFVSSLTQSAGSTLTTFNQAVNAAGNIDSKWYVAITLNGGVTTSGGGSVTITNSGLLTIADTGGAADTAVDLNLDGAFLQDGTGGVDIAGDITTTADSITFQRAVTLSGDVAIDSANGAVTFSTTVDDDAAGGAGDYFLAVDSGGGALTFNNDVGSARALNHLRLLGCGNLVVNVATNLSFQDIYIDAPGTNIVLQQDITLGGRLIFYRGNLNLNGNVLSSGSDFAVFGTSYNANDVDRGAASNEFAFPPAESTYLPNPLVYYPGDGTYTDATGAFSTGTNAAFTDGATFDLTGSTISVAGNFYVNGTFMEGDTAGADGGWTLSVQDTTSSDPVNNGPFGIPYAVAFNMEVSYCTTVNGGNISAASAAGAHSHNSVVDGGGVNQVYTFAGNTQTQNGWDFIAPYIVSAEIVKDNIIRITFNEPIENSNDEITAMVANGYTDHLGNASDTGFAANTAYVDNTDASLDSLPFTFTSADGDGDLTTFYVRASGGLTWCTDATGSNSSVSGTGFDSTGNPDSGVIPDISWMKGTFYDAGGKNSVRNYTENGDTTYSAATDDCGPVLYEIQYGRAVHNQPATRYYDGHSYFHLYYSEPVDIGTDAAFSAATPTAENVRSQLSFGAGEWGGDLSNNAGNARLLGFFEYNDPLGVGPMSRGARTGTVTANGMYRTDSAAGTAPFTNNDQELRVYLSGFLDGAVGSELFPGWQSNVPDPIAATNINVLQNTLIADLNGNEVDYTIDLTAFNAGPINGEFLSTGDVDPPVFSSYTVDFAQNPNEATSYEIVSRATTSTQLINRLEFHILDNSAIDYTNTSDMNENDPQSDGMWDPQNLSSTLGPLTHPNTRANEGIRDKSFDYFGGGSGNEYQAFTLEEVGVLPLVNTHNTGFDTAVGDTSLYSDVLPDINDSYFTLTMNDSGHSWGLLSDLNIDYDQTLAYITDLAGNIIQSTIVPIAAIERTPPRINLSLCAVGMNTVYLTFSEPIWGDALKTTDIDFDDFIISGNSPTSFSVLRRSPEGGGAIDGVVEGFLTLTSPLTANQALSLEIQPSAADVIFDKAQNTMLSTETHRITDVGIGVVEPVWASDSVHQDDTFGAGFSSLRDFTGADGSKLMDGDITLEASILASSYTALPVQLFYDVNPPADVVTDDGFWLPSFVSIEFPTPNTEARNTNPTRSTGGVRDFVMPGSDDEIVSGSDLEFLLRVGDLYAARITDASDPRTLQPWIIPIREIVQQAAGVTILNNVINPTLNEKTVLSYGLETAGTVVINVFNLGGDLVDVIFRGSQGSGSYIYTWDGTNRAGNTVARGIYFIRVVGPGIDEFRKVMVVK